MPRVVLIPEHYYLVLLSVVLGGPYRYRYYAIPIFVAHIIRLSYHGPMSLVWVKEGPLALKLVAK